MTPHGELQTDMTHNDDEQSRVTSVLASLPPPDVPADFVSRVNARIDATAGWFGLADFRLWTLRLAPAAGVLALIAVLWPASPTITSTAAPAAASETAASFSPASASDWQQDVSGDALMAAALQPAAGGVRVR